MLFMSTVQTAVVIHYSQTIILRNPIVSTKVSNNYYYNRCLNIQEKLVLINMKIFFSVKNPETFSEFRKEDYLNVLK